MSDPIRKAVLISEPQASNWYPFLPYIWGILKSWCERQGHLTNHLQWLDPIYRRDTPRNLLAPYRDYLPDVLGLSCYIWNWELQCQIAERVKSLNPRCLVVAGGPQPEYKDAQFFHKYPFIDMIAVKDGEITFTKILTKVLNGDSDYSDIGGLYLPTDDDSGPRGTGPAEVPAHFDHSPYVQQSAWYQHLIAEYPPGHFSVTLETNRGCPYACSFCDWGSNTMSKVRRFQMERVKADIECIARMKIKSVFLADANFGILPHDPEIADLIAQGRKRHGWPRMMYYSGAKNNPERTLEITRKLRASGIAGSHFLAIQHTHPAVLAAVDRTNIPVEKFRELARILIAEEIPTVAQLILGIPGDSCELWKNCLTDLMDWGLHNQLQVYNYALLPNSPAADRVYRHRWETDTISRFIPIEQGTIWRKDDQELAVKIEIIVSSKTYSRADWIRMKIWSTLVRALHYHGLTQIIAMYLHFSHAVSYREFYDAVIETWLAQSGIYQTLNNHFQDFITGATLCEDMITQISGQQWFVDPGRWFSSQFSHHFDSYFADMKTFLLTRFPRAKYLESAIDYQRNVIVLPAYDSECGKSFRTDFDWPRYVHKARRLSAYEPLGEPVASPNAVVEVRDHIPVNLDLTDPEERWRDWLEYTGERGYGLYFRELWLGPMPSKKLLQLFPHIRSKHPAQAEHFV